MMSVLIPYISRIFAVRFLTILVGITSFVVLLDVLSNGDEVLEVASNRANSLAQYAFLRLPEILSQVIPFCVLIAALLTLAELIRHSELVAIRSVGLSQFSVFIAFVPCAMLIVLVHIIVNEALLPKSVAALRAWGIGDYGKGLTAMGLSEGVRWMRQGPHVIRVSMESRFDKQFGQILIFERNDEGQMLRRIDAASADTDTWTLYDAKVLSVASATVTPYDALVWPEYLRPADLIPSVTHPREMPLPDVARAVENEGFGLRPLFIYETWFHKKIAAPAAILLMILLAVPLAHRYQRAGAITWMLVAGISLGFVFFVFDGMVLAMGEAGLLPPALAAWIPTLVMALIAQGLMYHYEGF